MKKSITLDLDARLTDIVLNALNNEYNRTTYRLEGMVERTIEDSEYNELVSYGGDLEMVMQTLLSTLNRLEFAKFCELDSTYRFLKLKHFKSKKKNDADVIVDSLFDEPRIQCDVPVEEVDFESILNQSMELDSEIINQIGKERFIELLKANYVENFQPY
jgi:hypothetical protein